MNEELLRKILEQFMTDLRTALAEVPRPSPEQEKEKEGLLTKRALLELISHEAIVLEAYKDSVGVWTWGIGVTDRSGHRVARYKDNPQTIERVIEVFKWLVETKYLPAVLEAFAGTELNEHQLAAALSFHYNTGGIRKASWVKSFKDGNIERARKEFLNWNKPKEVLSRRQKERDLFFDGKWSGDGVVSVIPVRKPSYTPSFKAAKRVNISEKL